MALVYRASETAQDALVSSLAVDKPLGVAQGDILLLHVGVPDIIQNTVGVPTGFSLVANVENGDERAAVYAKLAGASEPASYTVTFDPAVSARLGLAAWYSDDPDALIVVDRSATQINSGGHGTSHICPGVTTRYPFGALACFILFEVNEVVTPDAAMTARYEVENNRSLYLMSQEDLGAAGSTGTRTATAILSDNVSLVITVAIAELQPQPKAGSVQILLDQYILTDQSHTAELSAGNQPYETTTINAGGTTYEMVRGDAALRHAGYFSGVGAGYLEQEMEDRLGASATVHTALLLGTSITDCIGYVLPNNANFELVVSAPAKDVITVDGLWSQGSGLKRGKRFFDGLIDDLSDQDGIDLGAAGSGGGWAYLFVHEVFGSVTTATFDVESDSSDTFAGAAVEGTFSVTAAGAYEIELSGTIGRYVRLVCTSLGGADAFEATAVIAVAGVTQ